jgi:hypothetical protein
MNKKLWEMPIPPTAVYQGPFFRVLDRRQCEISFVAESEDSSKLETTALLFYGVETFKCTYLYSLGSIDRGLRSEAYGNLISIQPSDWLEIVKNNYRDRRKSTGDADPELQHMMIVFDDGPCFELICQGFKQV